MHVSRGKGTGEERGREEGQADCTEHGPRCGAGSHHLDLDLMTRVEIKGGIPNRMSHPGVLHCRFLHKSYTVCTDACVCRGWEFPENPAHRLSRLNDSLLPEGEPTGSRTPRITDGMFGIFRIDNTAEHSVEQGCSRIWTWWMQRGKTHVVRLLSRQTSQHAITRQGSRNHAIP